MRIRQYGDGDLALTRSLETDPIVMRHLGGIAAAEDRARAVHDKRMAGVADGDWYFTVFSDDDPAPAGLLAIWRSEFAGAPIWEFGAMFRPDYHGKRIALPAGLQIIADFQAAGRTDRLHCFTALGNTAAVYGAHGVKFRPIGECDLDYEGQPLRCLHWVRDL